MAPAGAPGAARFRVQRHDQPEYLRDDPPARPGFPRRLFGRGGRRGFPPPGIIPCPLQALKRRLRMTNPCRPPWGTLVLALFAARPPPGGDGFFFGRDPVISNPPGSRIHPTLGVTLGVRR